ncbi:EF-P 5-aminopentanol modification-associated protein YfmF [Hydrogenoanaerobacterium sp.]|uniref:EF-P 5-aminopentanol modification-associated protein YfmF n=1 Tax=Hydrogenoanaerobacterium sp. TaxID=2953763 RepID=UPI00289DA2F5|nr:insulinase family protein [Hydrogenoanaerobacterium sp.]
MSNNMVRKQLCEGVFWSTVTDAKFKSNRISCNLVLPLDENTVSDTAVVPFILRKRFQQCPDFTRLNERLCELYGAALDADVRKYGAYQILNVSIQSLDDRYTIDNDPITQECAKLVSSLLLEPYLVDGVFDAQDFELEKQYLIDTIESEINDKRDYAVSRCQSLLFAGEPFAVKRYGTKEQAEKITPQSAVKAYHEAIKNAVVEIMFIGCGNPAGAEKIFAESFSRVQRSPIQYKENVTKKAAQKVTEQTDRMDVSQSKLVMGFRIGELNSLEEANASKLMCALYGGTPFSRLFLNVREKHSLCYYCAARFDKATGSMLVDSGVEGKNKQKAQEEILKQLEVLKNGEFEQEELDNTILALVSALKSATDTLGGLEGWYLTQILGGTNQSPVENAEQVAQITKQQIMQAAQKVTLDTVYFLTGREGEADE